MLKVSVGDRHVALILLLRGASMLLVCPLNSVLGCYDCRARSDGWLFVGSAVAVGVVTH